MMKTGEPSVVPPRDRDALDPAAADSALLRRPSFGIRTRIALSFLLCFVVTGSVTLASSIALRRIEQKLYFLEVADRYTSNIQQARRYEKNYFLYGTDLPSAHEHVREARTALSGTAAEVERVVGRQTYSELLRHLDRYELLLSGLDGGPPRRRRRPPSRRSCGCTARAWSTWRCASPRRSARACGACCACRSRCRSSRSSCCSP
jgi:hypothetical protein